MSIEYQPAPSVSKSIWETIGLPARGTRLYDLVHQGLPFELLDQVASLLKIQRTEISKAICMSPTTLARRMKSGRLNTSESDRQVALIALYEKAISLFESDTVAAVKWMSSPVQGLGSRRPLDMVETWVETNAVFNLMGRLEMGVLV
ncbi:type II RES/Xre toxin-antitoxin system antitoxin [Pseudomonas mohnii]